MTTADAAAALAPHEGVLRDLMADGMTQHEAWRYTQDTLGIHCGFTAFRRWWRGRPGARDISQAHSAANGTQAAKVQQSRGTKRSVLPGRVLAAATPADAAVRHPVRPVSEARKAELAALLRARMR